VLRIESGLYFANADTVRRQILDAAGADGTRAVVLDAETTPFIDVTAAQMLGDLNQQLRARGISLLVARDVGQFRDVLEHASDDADRSLGYPTIGDAVSAAAPLDHS